MRTFRRSGFRDQSAAARKAWDSRGRGRDFDKTKLMADPKAVGDAVRPLAEPDGGFTYLAATLEPATTGFAVALKGSDRLILAADAFDANGEPDERLIDMTIDRIDAVFDMDAPPGAQPAIGAWHNPADGKIEVNMTAVFSADQRDAAVAFAQSHDQISMADLDAISRGDWDNAFVDTGGTGGDRTTDEMSHRVRRFHVGGVR